MGMSESVYTLIDYVKRKVYCSCFPSISHFPHPVTDTAVSADRYFVTLRHGHAIDSFRQQYSGQYCPPPPPPPGGGGALKYRGGPHLRYVFRGRRGIFLRPPHVRDFVKEGYFFVPRYEVWGSKSPYTQVPPPPRDITSALDDQTHFSSSKPLPK